MNRTIFKYPLIITDHATIRLSPLAKPLSVGLDPSGTLCLWALVHPETTLYTDWNIFIVGTGNPIPEEMNGTETFLGSVTQGMFVWHIFINRKVK